MVTVGAEDYDWITFGREDWTVQELAARSSPQESADVARDTGEPVPGQVRGEGDGDVAEASRVDGGVVMRSSAPVVEMRG